MLRSGYGVEKTGCSPYSGLGNNPGDADCFPAHEMTLCLSL